MGKKAETEETETEETEESASDDSGMMQKLSDLIDSRLDAFAERQTPPKRTENKPRNVFEWLNSLADG